MSILKEKTMEEIILHGINSDIEQLRECGFPCPENPHVDRQTFLGDAGRADLVITGNDTQGNLVVYVYELKRASVGFKDLPQITRYMAVLRAWVAEQVGVDIDSSELNSSVLGILIGSEVNKDVADWPAGNVDFLRADYDIFGAISFSKVSDFLNHEKQAEKVKLKNPSNEFQAINSRPLLRFAPEIADQVHIFRDKKLKSQVINTPWTAGPWRRDPNEGVRIYGPSLGHALAKTYDHSLNGIGVAHLTGGKNKADAILISSAPEMFHALIELADFFHEKVGKDNPRAVSAIRRALGIDSTILPPANDIDGPKRYIAAGWHVEEKKSGYKLHHETGKSFIVKWQDISGQKCKPDRAFAAALLNYAIDKRLPDSISPPSSDDFQRLALQSIEQLNPHDPMFGIELKELKSTYSCRHCDFSLHHFGTRAKAIKLIDHDHDCPVALLRQALLKSPEVAEA